MHIYVYMIYSVLETVEKDKETESDSNRQRSTPRPNTFLSRVQASHKRLGKWRLGDKRTVVSFLWSLTKYIPLCYVSRLLCKQMGEMLRVPKDHINSNK